MQTNFSNFLCNSACPTVCRRVPGDADAPFPGAAADGAGRLGGPQTGRLQNRTDASGLLRLLRTCVFSETNYKLIFASGYFSLSSIKLYFGE